jgi:hypothetical protein
MEDIRIGRKTLTSFQYVSVGVTASLIVKANPNRVSLTIGVPDSNPVVIGPDNSVSLTRGLGMFNTAGPFRFNIKDDGDWITRDIWGIGFAARSIGIIEGFLQEK